MIPLTDSLDGAFDVSDFLIHKNGFIPVPIIITEPALGGFGGGVVPVFIKKRPPYIDTVRGKLRITKIPPDVTGGAAAITLNNTWFLGVFKAGTIVKSRIKYTTALAFANINLSYYRTLEQVGEKEFKFNIKALPVLLQAIKRIGKSNWYSGLRYVFVKTVLSNINDSTHAYQFFKSDDYESIISQLGAIVELDNRDNIFTPDRGLKLHADASMSDNVLGSSFDFWRFNTYMYWYNKISPKIISGTRLDGQQIIGDPPFFILPYINMRGVEAARYQGNGTALAEEEIRWDFYRRWSITLFGGAGKAVDDWKDFGSSEWIASYGSGFRYLLARQFSLRTGVDVAKGPDGWTYYIVFGTSWVK